MAVIKGARRISKKRVIENTDSEYKTPAKIAPNGMAWRKSYLGF